MALATMYDEMELLLNREIGRGKKTLAYSRTARVLFLNKAQREAVDKIDIESIRELETAASNKSLTSGRYDLSSLSPVIFSGEKGVVWVKVYDGKYCTLIFESVRQANEQASYVYSSENPFCYYQGKYIYILPADTVAIDLLYKAEPTEMSLGSAEGSADDVDCALNAEVQDIIITLAVGLALEYGDEIVRGRALRDRGEEMIKQLNGEYAPTSPVKLEVGGVARGGGYTSGNVLNA